MQALPRGAKGFSLGSPGVAARAWGLVYTKRPTLPAHTNTIPGVGTGGNPARTENQGHAVSPAPALSPASMSRRHHSGK